MIRTIILGALLALLMVYIGLWRPAELAEQQSFAKLPISPQMWKWINESPSFNH